MEDYKKEEYLEKLVASKLFSELTTEERSFVMEELGNEEQYLALKKVHQVLESTSPSEIKPKEKTFVSLKGRFSQQYARPSLVNRIVFANVPAYAMVMLLLGVSITTWFITTSMQSVKTRTVMMAAKHDTVRVVTKADTVFVNRIKYRYIKTRPQPVYNFVQARYFEIKTDSTLSVSMKDKAELDNLLVTGLN